MDWLQPVRMTQVCTGPGAELGSASMGREEGLKCDLSPKNMQKWAWTSGCARAGRELLSFRLGSTDGCVPPGGVQAHAASSGRRLGLCAAKLSTAVGTGMGGGGPRDLGL